MSRGVVITMKGVPEEEEEEGEEVWSSLTTPPPRLPVTLVTPPQEDADAEAELELAECLPEPPDGGWGWVVVVASFLCNMVVDGVAYSFGIFLIEFVDYYGSSKGKTSWIGSLLTGCYLSSGPVVSALTNKFGCRSVTIAGSLLSSFAFLISTAAPSVEVLMLTYGIIGGVGFGLIYLPAIISVSQYFSTKRGLATGIAVCGSGAGAFVFAPLAQCLLQVYTWQGALMILAGLALNCSVFGALVRPLEPPKLKRSPDSKKENPKKRTKDSLCLLNTEPGVQSTLDLDKVSKQTPLLSPLTNDGKQQPQMRGSAEAVPGVKVSAEPSGGSTHRVDGTAPPKSHLSHINMKDMQRRFTMPAVVGVVGTPPTGPRGESWSARRQSRRPSAAVRREIARPLYRKDVFYSGSIVHLPQYRLSGADIRSYMASVTTIPDEESEEEEGGKDGVKDAAAKKRRVCPRLPRSMRHALSEGLDFSLLSDPVFLLACVANVLGMMGFYIPFVYVADSAIEKGMSHDAAAMLLSIIGISNLAGRLISGWVADRPGVRALDLNNAGLTIGGIGLFALPACFTYPAMVAACVVFSLFVSVYISLTSIILVDIVGLDRLTNSFGLLCLFRGAACILGPPFAGLVYEWTESYDIPFYFAGSLLVASALCTFAIPWMRPMGKDKTAKDNPPAEPV